MMPARHNTMTAPDVYIDPNRPRAKFRPLKAMGHMNKLLADKEDTAQVFHIAGLPYH